MVGTENHRSGRSQALDQGAQFDQHAAIVLRDEIGTDPVKETGRDTLFQPQLQGGQVNRRGTVNQIGAGLDMLAPAALPAQPRISVADTFNPLDRARAKAASICAADPLATRFSRSSQPVSMPR